MGVHPTRGVHEGRALDPGRRQAISLVGDDIEATRPALSARGATFLGGVDDRGFGLGTVLAVPSADPIMLSEPRHEVAYELPPVSNAT
jgi:hypothetical protein